MSYVNNVFIRVDFMIIFPIVNFVLMTTCFNLMTCKRNLRFGFLNVFIIIVFVVHDLLTTNCFKVWMFRLDFIICFSKVIFYYLVSLLSSIIIS